MDRSSILRASTKRFQRPFSNGRFCGWDMHDTKKKTVIAWVLVVVWAIVIFAMSAKSGLDLDSGKGIVSMVKRWLADVLSAAAGRPVDPSPIGHFGEYLVFGALLVNALRNHVTSGKMALGAIGIAALYAATDEFHQMFVPGRACDPLDWLVDVSAVAIVALIGWIILRKRV